MLGQALAVTFSDLTPTRWDKEDLDITDEKAVSSKLEEEKPEVIINAAAYTDVDGAEDNEDLAKQLNAEAVKYLANTANKIDASLVQYSTAYVFDGEKKEGYQEDDLPYPQSVYGMTKLAGEREAQEAKKHYILRLHGLFGKAGNGKKSFVEKILQSSVGKTGMTVVDEEEGSPTYAPDLAKQTRYILEHKLTYGIYHAANSGTATWYAIAKEIFKIEGIDIELVPVDSKGLPRKAKRPKYAILRNTKLPAMRSWQEALEEFLKVSSV